MVKFWQVWNIALKSSYRKCSIKKAALKKLAILIGKHLRWSLFLIDLQAYKPTTLLQRDSNTGVFLWILWKFYKHLFQRTSVNDCFWTLLIQSGRNNGKNRDASWDNNRRPILNRCSWIHVILVSHYWPIQTHHNGKEIERKLRSTVLLTQWFEYCQ